MAAHAMLVGMVATVGPAPPSSLRVSTMPVRWGFNVWMCRVAAWGPELRVRSARSNSAECGGRAHQDAG
eukprot:358527-Chlamydomonas_euryale.AAC.3